ncbi:hypothetical protein SK128_012453 [Halocaridina rubra]|uniref:Ig-like domain-containing protein n=1 Tax=Halocaridina rubra TaxID=373956 RepID=A0AAN8XTW1_HALRR
MRNDPPNHWKNPAHTGPKVAFDTFKHSLLLRRVTARDNGIYRCRMDFRTNPTLEYMANLTVIIPPLWIKLLTNREANSAGRYYTVTCQAAGARPPA